MLAPVQALKKAVEAGKPVQLDVPEVFKASTQLTFVSLDQRTLWPATQRAIAAIEAVCGWFRWEKTEMREPVRLFGRMKLKSTHRSSDIEVDN